MLIGTVDKDIEQELLSFIKDVNTQASSIWGVVVVDRAPLRDIEVESLVLAVKPALLDANKANVFFGKHSVYIAWAGLQGRTRTQLVDILTDLCDPLLMTVTTICYMNPVAEGNELSHRVKKEMATPLAVQPATNAVITAQKTAPTANKMSIFDKVDFAAIGLQLPEYKELLEKKRNHSKLHVLIIEDQPFLRQLLFEALRKDYEVSLATSVREGLAMYLKEAPHIVFLDIGLPDASGHMLAKKLRELDRTAYVVMVTGSRQRDDVEAARSNGAHGFIVKPFSKTKIQDAIGRYTTTHSNLMSGSLT